ncbi:MAG: DUF5024 domain-containing protein [Duncaniella sp.]|nr:DUF5024 domain-containing protein [Duncaniella sp.]
MTSIRNLLLTLCLSLISAAGYAQSSIDKIVESLENDKNVQEIMYSEQRAPGTRKLIKSSRLIQFSSEKILNKLISAFKKEREKATSYTVSNTNKGSVYSIRFNNGKGETAKYDLYQENNNRWMLSISIINSSARGKTKVTHSTDATPTQTIIKGNKTINIKSGDGLERLLALDDIDFIGNDDSSPVRIALESDDDENETIIIYSSSSDTSDFSSSKSVSSSKSKATPRSSSSRKSRR